MREIKFRYRFQHCRTKEIITAILTIEQLESPKHTPEVFGLMWDTLSRDQYTNNHDKTGRDLYERDVFTHDGEAEGWKAQIYFGNGAWMIRELVPDYGIAMLSAYYPDSQCEVIGNIYKEAN